MSKNIDSTKPFKLLDIGGGNGVFADRLLDIYPNLEITVLDNSEYLLAKNIMHPRKTLVCGSATMLSESIANEKYDIISLNWVLHHLVGDSRAELLKIIGKTLESLKGYLTPNGLISIIENLYPGTIIDSLPSKYYML